MRDYPVLETPRLRLRRPDEQDVGAIVAIAGDWEVASRLARMPHPYDASHARFFLDEIVTTELAWTIVLTKSTEMIGVIGLCACGDGRYELGYYLARSLWGQGIATEAGMAVVACAFDRLAMPVLHSGYAADNPASGRVLSKLGFRETGRAERPCLAAGGPRPSVEMRLDRGAG